MERLARLLEQAGCIKTSMELPCTKCGELIIRRSAYKWVTCYKCKAKGWLVWYVRTRTSKRIYKSKFHEDRQSYQIYRSKYQKDWYLKHRKSKKPYKAHESKHESKDKDNERRTDIY